MALGEGVALGATENEGRDGPLLSLIGDNKPRPVPLSEERDEVGGDIIRARLLYAHLLMR